jgi:hypothetical protein
MILPISSWSLRARYDSHKLWKLDLLRNLANGFFNTFVISHLLWASPLRLIRTSIQTPHSNWLLFQSPISLHNLANPFFVIQYHCFLELPSPLRLLLFNLHLVAEHHAGTVGSGRDIVAPVEDAVVEIWGCPEFVAPKLLIVEKVIVLCAALLALVLCKCRSWYCEWKVGLS